MTVWEQKFTFRNQWTRATFTVIGEDAVERMAVLPSWTLDTKEEK